MTDKKDNVFDIQSKNKINISNVGDEGKSNESVIYLLLHLLKAAKDGGIDEAVIHTRSPEGKVATFQAGVPKSPFVMAALLKEMSENYSFVYCGTALGEMYDDIIADNDNFPTTEEEKNEQIAAMEEYIEDLLQGIEDPEDFED